MPMAWKDIAYDNYLAEIAPQVLDAGEERRRRGPEADDEHAELPPLGL
jgi:hypothetical protein